MELAELINLDEIAAANDALVADILDLIAEMNNTIDFIAARLGVN